MTTKLRATIEDLYRVPDNAKAEIVDGEIVLMSPTGDMPARAGFKIAMSLSAAKLVDVSPRPIYRYIDEGLVYELKVAGKTNRVCKPCLLRQ